MYFAFTLRIGQKQISKEIAKIGNGHAKRLNVDDEAASIALLQGALSETILYKINNGNMEYVNKFREQNRNLPTFL